jgi:hypothetical protein
MQEALSQLPNVVGMSKYRYMTELLIEKRRKALSVFKNKSIPNLKIVISSEK